MSVSSGSPTPGLPLGTRVRMPRRARRLRPLTKFAIGVTALVIGASALKALVSPGARPRPCVVACASPPGGAGALSGGTFVSPGYGFSFGYPAGGQSVKVSSNGVAGLVYTRDGQLRAELLVQAAAQPTSLQHLIGSEASALSGLRIQNVKATGPVNGAEIGFTPGQGEFYSGNYTDDTGSVFPVKLGIVAVRRPTGWVDLVGISTIGAESGTALGFPVIDDVLDRWRWSR
jgi:hypothetical protein